MKRRTIFSLAGFVVFGVGAIAGNDKSSEPPVVDPGDNGNYAVRLEPTKFVPRIDNPFLPFIPGSRWVYESPDGSERIEIEVLVETRQVMGITATIVHDRVTEDGEVVEDTFDWYAQDKDGNVWYLGEDSSEYKGGKVINTNGSWEAGLDGALPGIAMRAKPTVGDAYRQEFYKGEAEDLAEVVGLAGTAGVRAGNFDRLVVVEEWTPLDAKVVENKYYAVGVGLVLEEKVRGGKGRMELISYTPTK